MNINVFVEEWENLSEKEREVRIKDLTKEQSRAILLHRIPKWEDLTEEQRKILF